jgi:hypothetical protein
MRNLGLAYGTSDDALDAAFERWQAELAAELPPEEPPTDEEMDAMYAASEEARNG